MEAYLITAQRVPDELYLLGKFRTIHQFNNCLYINNQALFDVGKAMRYMGELAKFNISTSIRQHLGRSISV